MGKKIAALFAAIALAAVGLVVNPQPAQASASAYTWVKHTNATGLNHRIMVKCHLTQDWRTLFIGDASGQVCGQNGWVQSIWAIDGDALYAINRDNGHETSFGRGYKGSIGGGYYYVYLSSFSGGGGGGGGGGGKVAAKDSQWGG